MTGMTGFVKGGNGTNLVLGGDRSGQRGHTAPIALNRDHGFGGAVGTAA
jgi:hypothetical protein